MERPLRVPQPVQQPGRVAKEVRVLLEIHADAAEQYLVPADVRLVGESRRVNGQEDDVVPLTLDLRRQRVVADTAAAIHLRSAGGEGNYFHATNFKPRTETRGGRIGD